MRKIALAFGLGAALAGSAAWAASLGIYPTIGALSNTDMVITYLHGQPVTNTGARFVNKMSDIWSFGHGMTTPSLGATGGTSPSIVGTDARGTLTFGTGTPTGATITFATAWAATPACAVTWQANLASMAYTVSTTAITITQTATSSDLVNYVCGPQS